MNGVYTGRSSQVFVQNLDTGIYELISRRPDGGPGNDSSYGVAISDDGRYVAFDSLASDLVADDTNGRRTCSSMTGPPVKPRASASAPLAPSERQTALDQRSVPTAP